MTELFTIDWKGIVKKVSRYLSNNLPTLLEFWNPLLKGIGIPIGAPRLESGKPHGPKPPTKPLVDQQEPSFFLNMSYYTIFNPFSGGVRWGVVD